MARMPSLWDEVTPGWMTAVLAEQHPGATVDRVYGVARLAAVSAASRAASAVSGSAV
jgi:hypothetical protein